MNTKGALHCDFTFTTISTNDQVRSSSTAICFWNQGTSEVTINKNLRLAPSVLDPVTGYLRGGESYTIQDQTGRMLITTFDITFAETIPAQPGVTPFNNLKVGFLHDLDNKPEHS